MTRLSRGADRLSTGSLALSRRLLAGAAAWCARGRREDLAGWKAVLGVLARVLLLVLGVYVLARVVRALPSLMWLVSSAWLIAAWRAGRAVPEPAVVDRPGAVPGEAMRALLLEVMGSDSAVHLSTVLDHLKKRPDTGPVTASWRVADLRSQLEALRIPVHPKVKAAGRGPTRGVRRVDLAPSPATAPETSTTPSTAA